jgi:hypothetical protein
MFEDFLEDFINWCIADGKSTPEEICATALKEIRDLDEKIAEIEKLRSEQANYRMIIRRLGGDIKRPKRKKASSLDLDFTVPEYKLDKNIRFLCVSVCNLLEKEKKATVRRILDNVAKSIDESEPVYIAIKWLVENGILERDNETIERVITLGPKWQDRPYEKSIQK